MDKLIKGQKIDITKNNPNLSLLTVEIGWKLPIGTKQGFDIDTVAFLLDDNEKCSCDADFVFYGNPKSRQDAAVHLGREQADELHIEKITIDLDKMPANTTTIAFACTIHDAIQRVQNFGQIEHIYLKVKDGQTNKEIFEYTMSKEFSQETAIVVGEFYKYKDQWKFTAAGMGYFAGLDVLCKKFGLEVEEDSQATKERLATHYDHESIKSLTKSIDEGDVGAQEDNGDSGKEVVTQGNCESKLEKMRKAKAKRVVEKHPLAAESDAFKMAYLKGVAFVVACSKGTIAKDDSNKLVTFADSLDISASMTLKIVEIVDDMDEDDIGEIANKFETEQQKRVFMKDLRTMVANNGVMPDEAMEAISIFDEMISVEKNDRQLECELLQEPQFTAEDFEDFEKCKIAALKGNVIAQYKTGMYYLNGEQVEVDQDKAVKWLKLAAEYGNADAQLELGLHLSNIGEAHERGTTEWFSKAAVQGHCGAQMALANCLLSAWGIEQDAKEAVKWYIKAADNGHVYACEVAAFIYLYGIHVSADKNKAKKYYDMSKTTATYNRVSCKRSGLIGLKANAHFLVASCTSASNYRVPNLDRIWDTNFGKMYITKLEDDGEFTASVGEYTFIGKVQDSGNKDGIDIIDGYFYNDKVFGEVRVDFNVFHDHFEGYAMNFGNDVKNSFVGGSVDGDEADRQLRKQLEEAKASMAELKRVLSKLD